jgi:peroxiredoxin 2/4
MNELAPPSSSQSTAEPRPLLLYDLAPDFHARTTMGEITLSSYAGRWVLLFSHPADFTPVCTSEFLGFARAVDKFRAINCELIGLSVDSLYAHIAWIRTISERFGVTVDFPVIEDSSAVIARAYGMIHPRAMDSTTVRGVFLIDPRRIIRAISWYPPSVGRDVAELLRLTQAAQLTDNFQVSTPEGWKMGDDVLAKPPITLSESTGQSNESVDWFFKTQKMPRRA